MPQYSYTARDKSGATQKGAISAADRGAATSSLMEKGMVPLLVKEVAAGGAKGGFELPFLKNKSVKLNDKVIFSRQFSTMINAGVPIVQSLAILREQATTPYFQSVIAACSKKVEGGATLSSALAEHPKVFSAVYVNMVKAGETGGILDEVLDRLATQQEKDAEIVSKVKGAMTYPAVIFTVTIGAFVFLMTTIVPGLAGIFAGQGAQLPIYTRVMLAMSSGLKQYGLHIAAVIVVASIVLNRYIHTYKGKRVWDKFLLKVPVVAPILEKVNIARFARTFGSLMSSGIAVIEALNVTASALTNTVYSDALIHVASEVKNGKSVSEPLKAIKAFPPIVSQMVAVGEETGQMDVILMKLAGFYEREVDTIVGSITSIIEPILIIALGGMVGFIVISVFGPISALSNTI
jgi:type IV pilus assembly protein PilC